MVYLHAPQEEAPWQPGAASRWWLHHSLASLQQQLKPLGQRLIVRHGPSAEALLALARETGARAVHYTRLYDPAIRQRDAAVAETLQAAGIETHEHPGYLLREPEQPLTAKQTAYRVFAPFYKTFADLPIQAPLKVPPLGEAPQISGLSPEELALLPKQPWAAKLAACWQPGEPQAQAGLAAFTKRAAAYIDQRDIPAADGVSRLSPHLHFGELAPHTVYRCLQAHPSPGSASYLRQLIWRDFAHYLLWHCPRTAEQPFQASYRDFPWRDDAQLLTRWQRGQTGFPMLDAAMRELWQSGYMHNRLRMLTASFLSKQGGIDWRQGARWFWDTLVDANLANNTFGWQWSAGCGADAAPYFRIFNPVLQGQRWDAQSQYVKRWVAELRPLADDKAQEPWCASPPPADYPPPCLDLKAARAEALARSV